MCGGPGDSRNMSKGLSEDILTLLVGGDANLKSALGCWGHDEERATEGISTLLHEGELVSVGPDRVRLVSQYKKDYLNKRSAVKETLSQSKDLLHAFQRDFPRSLMGHHDALAELAVRLSEGLDVLAGLPTQVD